MDIARPDIARKKKRQRILFGVIGLIALAGITLALSRLQPAAPTVDKATVWMDTVKRGEMLRQVRGNGTLVPEDIRWIPTVNAGRVERILALPGAAVRSNTVLVELSNPEVAQAAFDAEWQLKAAEAELTNLQVQLDTQKLTQQASVASAQANYSNARSDYEVNDALAKDGLVAALTLKQSKTKADELEKLLAIQKEGLRISAEAAKAQLSVHEAKVAQLRAQLELKRTQLQELKIVAGMDGVLQRLGDATAPLQVGQQLSAGAPVARVANPSKLKAEIKIAETQAKDIQLGQVAEVDTRNGVIPGRVMRIDPAVQNGTVTVDVSLDGPLPKGARPDLSVDGTITLEHLEDVLYVGRPVNGQADSKVSLFRVTDNGSGAIRVPVQLGRASVTSIEIVNGLKVGEQVILSDMSQWDAYDRIRLD